MALCPARSSHSGERYLPMDAPLHFCFCRFRGSPSQAFPRGTFPISSCWIASGETKQRKIEKFALAPNLEARPQRTRSRQNSSRKAFGVMWYNVTVYKIKYKNPRIINPNPKKPYGAQFLAWSLRVWLIETLNFLFEWSLCLPARPMFSLNLNY